MQAPLEAGKDRELDSLLETPEATQPADLFWTSDLLNGKIKHLCCLAPLSL